MNNEFREIAIFKTDDEVVNIDVLFEDDTVWLTQKQLVELYRTSKSNISEHLKHIFESEELDKEAVVRNFRTTADDGKIYNVAHYNLDAIIALGYRVNSIVGTRFRQWATKRLNEYIRKGYTMDDQRLKELGGGDYWHELMDRIRDIRASEKVFYRQVLEIYSTSIDYDPKSDISKEFFKKVQNKMHFAVHGQTAAEVIYDRADAEKKFMGLKSFSGKEPQLKDVVIAKNYLDEAELKALGQIVSGYLDFAERQAERQIPMKMKDWSSHLDQILTATGEKLLEGAGKISHEQAIDKATGEYKKYRQRVLSEVEKDFLGSISKLAGDSKVATGATETR